METPALHVEVLLRLFRERRFDEAMEYLEDLAPEERESVRCVFVAGEHREGQP